MTLLLNIRSQAVEVPPRRGWVAGLFVVDAGKPIHRSGFRELDRAAVTKVAIITSSGLGPERAKVYDYLHLIKFIYTYLRLFALNSKKICRMNNKTNTAGCVEILEVVRKGKNWTGLDWIGLNSSAFLFFLFFDKLTGIEMRKG